MMGLELLYLAFFNDRLLYNLVTPPPQICNVVNVLRYLGQIDCHE